MAKIYLVKVRSQHDLAWHLPMAARYAARMMGVEDALKKYARVDGRPFMPQLVLPYLGGLIDEYNRKNGTRHEYEIIDEQLEDLVIPADADMVWFTINTSNSLVSYRSASILDRRGVVTVAGGIHASIFPEEAGRFFHTVATGEGEQTVAEMLQDHDRNGSLKPRYHGSRKQELDGLPLPAWPSSYDYAPWVVPVQTSRGCRNACSFCSTTRFQGSRRRHRPVEEIVAEIRYLKETGQYDGDHVLFFTDNNIVSDSDHRRGVMDTTYARKLFKAIEPLKITWVGQGEISVADDLETVELMSRSGCRMLLVGFESLSKQSLAEVGKPLDAVDEYRRSIERLQALDIGIIGCFIFGFDSDGPSVFEESCDFISQHVDVPQLSILTPMPGTRLFRKMERQGRLLDRNWSKYDITHVTFRPARMTPEELEEGYRWISNKIYSLRACLARSYRYAARPVIPSVKRLPFNQRFTFILAPNIIYRGLSLIGRRDEARIGYGIGVEMGKKVGFDFDYSFG